MCVNGVIFHTENTRQFIKINKSLENTWLGNCDHADRGCASAGHGCSFCSAPIAHAREVVSVYALKAAAAAIRVANA